MKITNNYPLSPKPTFGMSVIATEEAIAYMNRTLSPKQIKEANALIKDQYGKKPNVHFQLGSFVKPTSGHRMNYLRAKVNDTIFKEGLFTTAFGVVKKSIEYVKELQTRV